MFAKHGDILSAAKWNPNHGLGELYAKMVSSRHQPYHPNPTPRQALHEDGAAMPNQNRVGASPSHLTFTLLPKHIATSHGVAPPPPRPSRMRGLRTCRSWTAPVGEGCDGLLGGKAPRSPT
eukprot:scaffold6863_cov112-Isochrysis_galbana.AAC.2